LADIYWHAGASSKHTRKGLPELWPESFQ